LRRAEAVRRGLIDRGIDPGRLEVGGVGAADPLVPFDGTDLLRNRRIELYLID
jgi:outer membrane protein OmpA-like peptidoglycan-associated protein